MIGTKCLWIGSFSKRFGMGKNSTISDLHHGGNFTIILPWLNVNWAIHLQFAAILFLLNYLTYTSSRVLFNTNNYSTCYEASRSMHENDDSHQLSDVGITGTNKMNKFPSKSTFDWKQTIARSDRGSSPRVRKVVRVDPGNIFRGKMHYLLDSWEYCDATNVTWLHFAKLNFHEAQEKSVCFLEKSCEIKVWI